MRRLGLGLVAVVLASCTGATVTTESVPTTTSTTSTSTTTIPTTTTTEQTINISGRVVDDEGDPVARAFAILDDQVAVTGPDGWFNLTTAVPMPLTVSKPGWTTTELAMDEETTYYEAAIEPVTIRGVRVAAEAAQSDEAFAGLLELADTTAVNALVFDTKTEAGHILYETRVEAAHEIGAVNVFYDPVERIEQAHAAGLYTITRVVAFEDDVRAKARPDERLVGPWLDPASETARGYVLDIAEEACELGFDEIQFDYVRYPSGRAAEQSGQRDLTQQERLEAVGGFLSQARDRLHPMGCAVAAAVFGIVTSSPDDQGLGQRPEEVSAQVDVLSPMIYPSHYSPGWLGFEDPNDHPYDVTADAISDAIPRLHETTRLRPYLQAFWWSNEQIRRSIQAAEDAGTGWLLWNILSNFDQAALPGDDEVGP